MIAAAWFPAPLQQPPTRADRLVLADRLIGLPWRSAAEGPDAFNCWGLMRLWHLVLWQIDMGAIAVAVDAADVDRRQVAGRALPLHAEQMPAIRHAIRSGGWLEVSAGPPREDDVLLLRNLITGGRHIAVLLLVSGVLGALHCEGDNDHPEPGVVWQPLADVLATYVDPIYYRRPTAGEAAPC